MTENKNSNITNKNVTDWLCGRASPSVTRAINEDLSRDDSEVKEYLKWVSTGEGSRPRIVSRSFEERYKRAGGEASFVADVKKLMRDDKSRNFER